MPKPVGPTAKRLKLRDESTPDSASETSKSSRKTRGKMTRSNENVGSLTMEQANRLAEKVTGYHSIDLRLPHRQEADAANSMKWISTFEENDVVIHRKLCMICMQNPMDAFLKRHVHENHPETSSEAAEVMRRMSDVRYTRFCTNGFITNRMIQELVPNVSRVPLINFLADCGITYLRKSRIPRKSIDFENSYKETDIRGVSHKMAEEIMTEFHRDGLLFQPELAFSADLVTSSRMLDPSTQKTVCCHICEKVSNVKNFSRHLLTHRSGWDVEKEGCSLNGLSEVFKRITETRTALYYAAQPIQHSKILEICGSDADGCQWLVDFLLNAGFVIASGEMENAAETMRKTLKIIVFDPESEEMPLLSEEDSAEIASESDELEPPELISESESSASSRRSRSSSVTSDTSSASTSSTSSSNSRIVLRPSSSPSDEPFPYCVINGITEHVEVEHALFDLLEAMTDDANFALDQSQFGFLLGYTSYCLVVANGSKQNVISKMTMGDYRSARFDESSGLHYFSFSSKTSYTQKDTIEYVCADERIWRALEIFEVARERRVREAEWDGMSQDSSPFFCSYMSQSAIVKDTNYPMSQFLRMCGINWPCRSGAICSAAWSLVPKDSGKSSHHQYAITYFKFLREKERSQIQLINNGGQLSGHPTYRKIISVVISKMNNKVQVAPHEKVRKKQKRYTSPDRRGMPNRPRGGDHKSEEFCRRTGREYVMKTPKREPKRRRRSRKEMMETTVEEQADDTEISAELETPAPWNLLVEEVTNHPHEEVEYRVEAKGDLLLTCL